MLAARTFAASAGRPVGDGVLRQRGAFGQAGSVDKTQMEGDGRARTYSWRDPAPFLTAMPTTPGLALLEAMTRGEIPEPPIARTIGFEDFQARSGQVTVTLRPAEHHLNPLGTVHGGVICTLLDTVCGCAVHTTLDAGTGYTSLDLNTRFLRPVTAATGLIRCVGEVIARGSRTATAQARLVDANDRLLAHATSTCLLFPIGRTLPD
jgi:uncharacterized protein (TIGR00369 family)